MSVAMKGGPCGGETLTERSLPDHSESFSIVVLFCRGGGSRSPASFCCGV